MEKTTAVILIKPPVNFPGTANRFGEVFAELADVTFFIKDENAVTYDDIASVDIVIFQRCYSLVALSLLYFVKQLAKQSIYDIDDYILDSPNENFPLTAAEKLNVELFLKNVDTITSPQVELKRLLLQYNNNIVIITNTLPLSLFVDEVPKMVSGKPIRLVIATAGYFRLQNGQDQFFAYLDRLFATFADIELYYIGSFRTAENNRFFQKYSDRIKNVGHIDGFRKYIEFLQNHHFDIALVPLEDTQYNRCKSNCKYIEFSGVGIPAIYSKMIPYTEVVRHSENGLLVNNNEQDWYSATVELINNHELRHKIANNAFADVKEHFNMHVACESWKVLFDTKQAFKNASVEMAQTVLNGIIEHQVEHDNLQYRYQELQQQHGELNRQHNAFQQSVQTSEAIRIANKLESYPVAKKVLKTVLRWLLVARK